ncbi:hypothetical protein C8J57DRAFT_1334560 [Mycena rebaudengoi]|nr:hypothetical protein C8J57DRAFT_1334560 [Mycena rebaudengoi]
MGVGCVFFTLYPLTDIRFPTFLIMPPFSFAFAISSLIESGKHMGMLFDEGRSFFFFFFFCLHFDFRSFVARWALFPVSLFVLSDRAYRRVHGLGEFPFLLHVLAPPLHLSLVPHSPRNSGPSG